MISIVIISRDEPGVDDTLTDIAAQARALEEPAAIIVVDASEERLDLIRQRHEPAVRWLRSGRRPESVFPSRTSATSPFAWRTEIIVFTDACCRPEPGWLKRVVHPLYDVEQVTAGLALAPSGDPGLYGRATELASSSRYLIECPTINRAFRREAFDTIGGFDDRFVYGSDVDFSWRLVDAGYRIRSVPDSVVLRHDWGTWRRQLRRSYAYARARVRLYRKHRARIRRIFRTDPTVVMCPVFLLGLPLTVIFPLYPAPLLVPAWRNRSLGAARVVAHHLTFGAGVLAELVSR